MPFENKGKTRFKDLTASEQVEIIDVLSGKYNDREVRANSSIDTSWRKKDDENFLYLDGIYRVVQKDITVCVLDGYCDTKIINYSTKLDNIPKGTYKLVKIED